MTRIFTAQAATATLFASCLVLGLSSAQAAGGGASTLGKSQDASTESAARAASGASAAKEGKPRNGQKHKQAPKPKQPTASQPQ
jgi:hypothetical protein